MVGERFPEDKEVQDGRRVLRKLKRKLRERYPVEGEEVTFEEIEPDDFILFGSPGDRKPGSNFRQWTLSRVFKVTKKNIVAMELWDTWIDDQGSTHMGGSLLYYAKESLKNYKLYRIGRWKRRKETSGTSSVTTQ